MFTIEIEVERLVSLMKVIPTAGLACISIL
jgi:hypothetical protein